MNLWRVAGEDVVFGMVGFGVKKYATILRFMFWVMGCGMGDESKRLMEASKRGNADGVRVVLPSIRSW